MIARDTASQHRVGVFVDLLGAFEETVITGVVVEFTGVGRITAADRGAVCIDSAAILIVDVVALVVNQQVPTVVIDKDRNVPMEHVPTEMFVVLSVNRSVDRESKVSTAFGGAVITEHRTRCEILAAENGG